MKHEVGVEEKSVQIVVILLKGMGQRSFEWGLEILRRARYKEGQEEECGPYGLWQKNVTHILLKYKKTHRWTDKYLNNKWLYIKVGAAQ